MSVKFRTYTNYTTPNFESILPAKWKQCINGMACCQLILATRFDGFVVVFGDVKKFASQFSPRHGTFF